MRLLASSLAALAMAPPFGVWDLQRDLSASSKNVYGDVAVKPRSALRSGTLVRCGSWCRFGSGWLSFARSAALVRGDVAGASSAHSKQAGWTVSLRLSPAGKRHWAAFEKRVRVKGVPDVLVVAVGGQITALPLASQTVAAGGTITFTGFTAASAKATAAAFR